MRNDNLIVYKYRNWKDEFHKNVLDKNEVYLSSPDEFNDPFDCNIPVCYSLLDSEDKLELYARELIERQKLRLLERGRNIEDEYNRVMYRLKNEINVLQEEHSKFDFQNLNKYCGIYSLSKNWNNILMWSHYSDCHKGYSVGFFEEKLRNILDAGGRKVVYNQKDDYPLINPMQGDSPEMMLEKLHYKAYDWEYEEEYRLTKFYFPDIATLESRKIVIPNDCFAEVIIGFKADSNTIDQILEVGRKKKIKVYRAIQVPFKFKLDRIEIK